MKILVVHNDYQRAGGERVAVQAHVELLRSHGHAPVVYWRDNAEIAGYGLGRKAAFAPGVLFNRRTYRELRALAARERPAVAHVHNVFPLISPSAYRALRDAGVPVVQTLHNFRFLCPNGLFYTHGRVCERCAGGNTLHAVRLRCYRDSAALSALYAAAIGLHRRAGTFSGIDRFLAPTDFVARKFAASGLAPAERIRVLGNVVSVPAVPPPPPCPRPYALFMGRLAPEKGPAVAVAAMAQLPAIDLLVLGEGPEAARLELLARDLPNVRLLGHVGGEERWRLLQGAAATVVPSTCYETFGLAALESMAAGVPVVASNLGGLPSLVEHGATGLLFEPGNADDLAAQVRALVARPAEAAAMGRTGAALARTRFSPEAHYRELMAVYTESAKGCRP